LLGHGPLLGLHQLQGVLRGEHLEIGLGGPHQEVLCGGIDLGIGQVDQPPWNYL
jgi:hypothetical protein